MPKLWDKFIETYSSSNYEDNHLFIVLNNLSSENQRIIEKVMKVDNRYYYDFNINKYGIRVSGLNDNSMHELSNLTTVFKIQDNLRYISVGDYIKNLKDNNPQFTDSDMIDFIRDKGKLYLKDEGRIYDNELYLNWHQKYLKLHKQAELENLTFMKDTYIEAERNYYLELCKDKKILSIAEYADEVSIDVLINLVYQLLKKLEDMQVDDVEINFIEQQIMIYQMAIKNKLNKKSVIDKNYKESML